VTEPEGEAIDFIMITIGTGLTKQNSSVCTEKRNQKEIEGMMRFNLIAYDYGRLEIEEKNPNREVVTVQGQTPGEPKFLASDGKGEAKKRAVRTKWRGKT